MDAAIRQRRHWILLKTIMASMIITCKDQSVLIRILARENFNHAVHDNTIRESLHNIT